MESTIFMKTIECMTNILCMSYMKLPKKYTGRGVYIVGIYN